MPCETEVRNGYFIVRWYVEAYLILREIPAWATYAAQINPGPVFPFDASAD